MNNPSRATQYDPPTDTAIGVIHIAPPKHSDQSVSRGDLRREFWNVAGRRHGDGSL